MSEKSNVPPEGFDDLLAWLNPNRELASAMYLDIRDSLIRIFAWNRCQDPEGMTDEVFDRVVRKVPGLKATFEGNPRLFFYGVANNLIKEYQKKINTYVRIEDIELTGDAPSQDEIETRDMRENCLHTCLLTLTKEKRDLILSYYAKEKQAKIIHRAELARHLGISIETLRVRVLRIRGTLAECIERCLDQLVMKQ